MLIRRFTIFAAFLALLGMFLVSSCIPERKIGMTFKQSVSGINLLVIAPDYVLKYNHKGEEIEDFKSLSPEKQDSALWVNSRFIQHLTDSAILENYMNKFIGDLRTMGFTVYLQTAIDSFMTGKPQSYIVDISQMQIDEYNYPLEDEADFNDTTYRKVVNLNAVDFSCWFDLSKANTENARKTVLYHTASTYDSFEGRFFNDPFTGAVHYKYRIDSLHVRDVNAMSGYMGHIHAGYLFDFFMNQYIAKHLPEGMEMQDYFHYDFSDRTFSPADDDRFRVLDNK